MAVEAVGALGKVCKSLAKALKLLENESNANLRQIETLRERIKKLESQPDPDMAQIQDLENDIRELEVRLETLSAQHTAISEEFSAECTKS